MGVLLLEKIMLTDTEDQAMTENDVRGVWVLDVGILVAKLKRKMMMMMCGM